MTFNADVTIDSGNRASTEGSLNIVSSKILLNGNLGDAEQIMKVSSDGSKLEWSTPDFTSEAYVNSLSFGLTSKGTCKAATTENLTAISTTEEQIVLSGVAWGNPPPYNDGFHPSIHQFVLDQEFLSVGERVLIKDNVNDEDKWNGIYIIGPLNGDSVTLTRADDFKPSTGNIAMGSYVDIDAGNTQINKRFVLTSSHLITFGTTPIVFTEFSGAALLSLQSAQQAVSGLSIIGITGDYASEWKMDAPNDNTSICVGSLYITASGSSQTQENVTWTGDRNLFIGSGAGGYRGSDSASNTFIGCWAGLVWPPSRWRSG